MKKPHDPQSGRRRSGNKPATPARRRARGSMSRVSPGWRELTEEGRTAWKHVSRQVWTRGRKGRRRRLRGQELYVKINAVLGLCGYEPRRLPPPPTSFGANPVEKFEITNGASGVRLKLFLRKPPEKDILVFGSWPRSAGQESCSSGFSFLGLLPARDGLERDITALYLTKLREVQTARRLRVGRGCLGHKLHDVTRLQGDVHPTEQLLRFDQGGSSVAHKVDLAGIRGAMIIGRYQGLGQGQTFRPRNDAIPDLAVDRDARPLGL